jgi:hypothetical protein
MAAISQLPRDDEYAAARREYSDRYQDLAAGKRNWQLAALGFFLVAVLTSAISIIQVRQVKRIPLRRGRRPEECQRRRNPGTEASRQSCAAEA